MPSMNLANQNDTLEVAPLSQRGSAVVVIATGPNVSATAVFVVEVQVINGQYIAIGVFNAITQAKADNVTGPNQYAWTDAPGAYSARVRRTDNTGGDGTVSITQQLA